MYPFIRMAWQVFKHRKAAPLALTGTHFSRHVCLPWDIDLWKELNNGRTLTIYDLGRIPLAIRTGLAATLRVNGWGLTVAGASVRYRRRVRMFETVEMRSRAICWDARFIYIEQSMWRASGDCANHILYRSAITGANGIVAPAQAIQAMGGDGQSPTGPGWVAAWIKADAQRPWPPMQD
ncbi:MAG: acyl-CoA thioesterase [Rhodobacteraceae bacterium]|nr:acyl-CoA thioesterase [Paracoccaceae bacterium]